MTKARPAALRRELAECGRWVAYEPAEHASMSDGPHVVRRGIPRALVRGAMRPLSKENLIGGDASIPT